MSKMPPNLCWVDIETTGLSPKNCAILEVGLIITTPDLKELTRASWVCAPSLPAPVTDIDPYVWEMHTKNGLWKESLGSKTDISHIAIAACDLMKEFGAYDSPMSGSSVHFDRAFLKAQAPVLENKFHYRNLDVSSVRNFFSMFNPGIVEKRPRGEIVHRVLEDLDSSIAELKYYVETVRGAQ